MKRRPLLAGAIGFALLLVIWEIGVRIGKPQPFVLRSPSRILSVLGEQPLRFFKASLATGGEAVVILIVSTVLGVLIGSLLSVSRFAEDAANPLLVLIQVTPFAAYAASVSVLLDGFNTRRPIYFTGVLVCLPLVVYASISGLRGADRAAIDLLRSAGASRTELWRHVRLPSATPQIFTAARYNVGLALIAAYLIENTNFLGLGATGKRSVIENDGDLLWATVVCMATLGVVGVVTIRLLERVVLRWHVAERTDPVPSTR